jgi:hypothetical protein
VGVSNLESSKARPFLWYFHTSLVSYQPSPIIGSNIDFGSYEPGIKPDIEIGITWLCNSYYLRSLPGWYCLRSNQSDPYTSINPSMPSWFWLCKN